MYFRQSEISIYFCLSRSRQGADGVRDDIGEALKWRRMRDEEEDVHVY
jgi:hypothetical protein